LLRKSNSPIGYAEAKDLGVALPAVLRSAQIRRYQVCEKWLKDRKGRPQNLQDLDHYRSTVAALTHTHTLMDQIEAVAVGAL